MKNTFWIVGKHTVQAAIDNPKRKIVEIYLSKENQFLLKDSKKNKDFKISIKNNSEITKVLKNKDIAHQGFAAFVEKIDTPTEQEILLNFKEKKESTFLILDDLTDERNIGSIVRTAAAFYVDAIFLLKKNYNYDSQSMYKSASGAMEHIAIIPVVNLTNTTNLIKKNNYWILGLDGEGSVDLINFEWPLKTTIILGSEGFGMRRLVKENCDEIARININPKIESLNVSNAVASCLALNLKQKKSPGK
jgi:23S rRNA (guanosine2251-2'-O)-methyltransferase